MTGLVALAAVAGYAQLPCDPGPIYSAARAERLVLSCKKSSELYLLDGGTGALISRVELSPISAADRSSLAIAPDGQTVALALRDGSIVVWRQANPSSVVRWKEPFYANSLSFTPDGTRLAVDGRLVDPNSGHHLGTNLAGDFDAPNDIAYDEAGKTAFVAEADTTVRAFEVRTGKETARYSGFAIEPMAIAFNSRDATVVVALADGSIHVLTPDLRLLHSFAGPSGSTVYAVLARGRSALFAAAPQSGGSPPKPYVLDLSTGQWAPMKDTDGFIGVSLAGTLRGYWAKGKTLTIKRIDLEP